MKPVYLGGWLVKGYIYENCDTGFSGVLQLAWRDGHADDTSVQYWDTTDRFAVYKSGWHGSWRYSPQEKIPHANSLKARCTQTVFFDYLGRSDAAEYKKHVIGLDGFTDRFECIDCSGCRIKLRPVTWHADGVRYGGRLYHSIFFGMVSPRSRSKFAVGGIGRGVVPLLILKYEYFPVLGVENCCGNAWLPYLLVFDVTKRKRHFS